MKLKICCVPGCGGNTSKMHYIPKNPQIQQVWLERIGNKKLSQIDVNLLRGYAVCDKHFDAMCKNPSGKLLRYSLPTNNLPAYNIPSDRGNCFAIYRNKVPIRG
ncbi:unnamed protein product [Callosobruchus maculatus]|uniref:THAP-type domain-containing protein n=1 Tax=Callosobruchus maculatus TaxID=64391 RepID=A0A653DCH7_CALMS|nr:unnamed protein product [Callosobruchus maculatus]